MNTPAYVLSLTATAASVRVAVPAVLQGWRVWWRVCRSLRAQRYRARYPTLVDWPDVVHWSTTELETATKVTEGIITSIRELQFGPGEIFEISPDDSSWRGFS